MNDLPEPHRANQLTPEHWEWPECTTYNIGGQEMFCSDVFRAAGSTLIRMVARKHLDDYEARRYVPASYFTTAEWMEIQA